MGPAASQASSRDVSRTLSRPALLVALYSVLGLVWFSSAEYLSGGFLPGAQDGLWRRLAVGMLFIALSGSLIFQLLRSMRNADSSAEDRTARHLPVLVQLLALALAILIPLLALLGFVVFDNARQEARMSRSVALDLAVVTAGKTEQFLQTVRAQIDEIAARPLIRAMDEKNCDPILIQFRLLNPTFTAIVLFDTAGEPICPQRPAGVPGFTNYAGSEWFREILETGVEKLRRPYIGPVSGRWIVAYLAPARDNAGKTFGVIDISFDLRQFQPVTQQKLISGATLSVIDSGAMTVADSSDSLRVGRDARGQLFGTGHSASPQADLVDVALKARSGETLALTASGEQRIVGYAPIAGTDWIALATVPSERAFALSLFNSLKWGVPIVLLALVLVWLIARAIERPIRAVADAATDLAQGREPRRAPEAGSSETSQVARRFNSMVQTLDRSQRELQESEARFRALTLLSSDWFWELDADLRVTELSGVESPALTARRAALLGRHFWELSTPGSSDRVWTELREMLEGHRAVRDFEFSVMIDSQRRQESYFSASGEPRFDSAGCFLGYRGVTRNITKRKLAEISTRESETRFRSLTELSADWYWEQDEESRYTGIFQSPLFPASVGRATDAIGKRPWELPSSGMDDAAWSTLRKILAGRRPYFDFEITVPDQRGGKRVWLSSGLPVFDDGGEFRGYRGITRDVTERRNLEQRLGLFETVARQANDMIVLVSARTPDAKPTILFANPAYCSAVGYSAEELVGQPALPPEGPRTDRAMLDSMIERVRQGEPFAGETWAYRRYGEPFAVEFRVDPLRDAAGRVSHFVLILRDVTERRETTEQLARLNRSLEMSVRARTRELEDTLREYEAFSYSVSHDLRGPLRSISGFSKILQEDHLPPEDQVGREYLERVMTATRRMGLMIDAMLELGQISRTELRREQIDFSALALEIISGLRRDAPHRKVEFVCAEGLVAEGDPALLRSLLDNLLGNAWKYSAQVEAARIEFASTQSAWGPAYLVRDNGAGFDMTQARRLFHPFQRMHSKEFSGTGIGLATVQRIVRRHSGRVWAQSAPDKGASFFFTLWENPAAASVAVAPEPDGTQSAVA